MGKGSEWLEQAFKLEGISPLGKNVADLLDDVWSGIYHLDNKQLKKVAWDNDHHIVLLFFGHLSTFDSGLLTLLVVLAHDRLLRVEVAARAPGYLELAFHQRSVRSGAMWQRMPTMETHLAILRQHYPSPSV